MTETVVHVTTLEQWKSVLDVWFEQGYKWRGFGMGYQIYFFENHLGRHLHLDRNHEISYWSRNTCPVEFIEYSEFMAQQKEDNKMATVYEVSQSVFDELQRVKAHEGTSLIGAISLNAQLIKSIEVGNKAILRYLADDPAIDFKVEGPLYRLCRIDSTEDKVYMDFDGYGTPDSTLNRTMAFTAPLDEIEKWKTPAWEIEKVDD